MLIVVLSPVELRCSGGDATAAEAPGRGFADTGTGNLASRAARRSSSVRIRSRSLCSRSISSRASRALSPNARINKPQKMIFDIANSCANDPALLLARILLVERQIQFEYRSEERRVGKE